LPYFTFLIELYHCSILGRMDGYRSDEVAVISALVLWRLLKGVMRDARQGTSAGKEQHAGAHLTSDRPEASIRVQEQGKYAAQ
jgi:hypothetical protein